MLSHLYPSFSSVEISFLTIIGISTDECSLECYCWPVILFSLSRGQHSKRPYLGTVWISFLSSPFLCVPDGSWFYLTNAISSLPNSGFPLLFFLSEFGFITFTIS